MKCTLEYDGLIKKLFEPEDKEIQNGRAKYSVEEKNNITLFHIEAKDAVALRAIMNAIIKLLIVDETVLTMRNYENDGRDDIGAEPL